MTDYTVTWEMNIEADSPEEAAQLAASLIVERVADRQVLSFTVEANGASQFVDVA